MSIIKKDKNCLENLIGIFSNMKLGRTINIISPDIYQKSLEHILSEINEFEKKELEQEKKNKELMAKIGITNWAENTWSDILDEKYISKNKIRQKLKECQTYYNEEPSPYMLVQIKTYEELLEEK